MRLIIYYLSFAAGLAAASLCSIMTGKKRGVEKRDAVIYTVTGFTAGVIGAVVMSQIYNAVIRAVAGGEQSSVSLFSLYGGLLFVPVLVLLPIRSAKKDYYAALDTCAAGVYLLLGTAKLGCHVYGCCYGVECSFGVINPQTGARVFPVQLTEAALTFMIAAAVYRYTLSKKRPRGAVYPAGLMIYGTVRFFIQFLRFHEIAAEADLIGFMDTWQTVSVIAVIAGAAWFFIIKKKDKKTDINI